MHCVSILFISVSLFTSSFGTFLYSVLTDGLFGTFDTDGNSFSYNGFCTFSEFNPAFSSSIDTKRNIFYIAGSLQNNNSLFIQALDIQSGYAIGNFSLPFLNNGKSEPTGVGIVADSEMGVIYAFGWSEKHGTQLISVNPSSRKTQQLFSYQKDPVDIWGYCFDSSTRIFATAIYGVITGVYVDSGKVAYTYNTSLTIIVCDSTNQKIYGLDNQKLYSLDTKKGNVEYLGRFFEPTRKLWDFSESTQTFYTMNSGYGGDWSLYEYFTENNTMSAEGNYYPGDFLTFTVY